MQELTRTSPDLVLMACSAAKRATAAPALALYQGVMYSTFRANVRPDAQPHVAILSALHGVIPAEAVIEPYDTRMTSETAGRMLANPSSFVQFAKPVGARNVLLAGGRDYRRVMMAVLPELIASGAVAPDAKISETDGNGIGYQRQQLGEFLRACAPQRPLEVVGHHPNGNPLYYALDGFKVGQDVNISYAALPGKPAEPAFVDELFYFRDVATACVRMLNAKNPKHASRWVAIRHMKPADHSNYRQLPGPGSTVEAVKRPQ